MFTAHNAVFFVRTNGQGTHEVTSQVAEAVRTSRVRTGALQLGTGQGVFLYEHRRDGSRRSVSVSVIGTTE